MTQRVAERVRPSWLFRGEGRRRKKREKKKRWAFFLGFAFVLFAFPPPLLACLLSLFPSSSLPERISPYQQRVDVVLHHERAQQPDPQKGRRQDLRLQAQPAAVALADELVGEDGDAGKVDGLGEHEEVVVVLDDEPEDAEELVVGVELGGGVGGRSWFFFFRGGWGRERVRRLGSGEGEEVEGRRQERKSRFSIALGLFLVDSPTPAFASLAELSERTREGAEDSVSYHVTRKERRGEACEELNGARARLPSCHALECVLFFVETEPNPFFFLFSLFSLVSSLFFFRALL